MVDEFQHIVYENPDMTPEERKQAWMKLEAVYRPHMDYEELDPFYSKGGFLAETASYLQLSILLH